MIYSNIVLRLVYSVWKAPKIPSRTRQKADAHRGRRQSTDSRLTLWASTENRGNKKLGA